MNKGKVANMYEEQYSDLVLETEEYMQERDEENKVLLNIIEGFRKFAQHKDDK